MNTRALRRPVIAGAFAVLSALAPLSVSSGFATAPPEDGRLDITGVDVAGFPTVTLEVGATGGISDGANLLVTENGEQVTATTAVVPTSGLEVVLLIDTSGSMNEGGAIDAAKRAALRFLEVLPPAVPVGIVSFDDTPALVSPLSVDRFALAASINALRADGETALYDSVVFARSLFSGGTNDRQLVLLSDGGDTVSGASIDDALAASTDVRTSAIELVSSEANRSALEQLVAARGGTLSSATDSDALEEFFQQVATSLVNRYRLTFASSASGSTTYTVTAATPTGDVEASISVQLPDAVTTAPAGTTAGTTGGTTGGTAESAATSASVVTDTAVPAATTPSSPTVGSESGASVALLILGAGAFFVSFLLLFVLALPDSSREHKTRDRLIGDRPVPTASGPGVAERVTGAADRMLDRQGRRKGLANVLDVAGISLRPGEFVVLCFAAGVVLALVLFSAIGPIGIIVGLAATPLLARMAVSTKADRRRRAFNDQLPELLQLLVSSLRGGYGLAQALDAVSSQSPEPTRTELQRVLFEVRIGRDPGDALSATAQRMKSRDFEWVVSAIQINREIGGELAHVLETVAETVRERQRLARQIQTLTAEGRVSAYVLIALPFVLVLGLSVTNPDYFDPMRQAPGPFLIVLGIVLLIVGWFWMRRLIKAQL